MACGSPLKLPAVSEEGKEILVEIACQRPRGHATKKDATFKDREHTAFERVYIRGARPPFIVYSVQ